MCLSIDVLTILAVKEASHLNIKTKLLANTLREYSVAANQNACLKVAVMLRWPAFLMASIYQKWPAFKEILLKINIMYHFNEVFKYLSSYQHVHKVL